MKYEDGYLIMEEGDIKLMSGLKLDRIEKSYEVVRFLSGMAELKGGMTEYLNERLSVNDRTTRQELQMEVMKLYIEICDMCSARAREAVADAGESIQMQ